MAKLELPDIGALSLKDDVSSGDKMLTMKEKLAKAAPYNLFFNKIPKLLKTMEDPNSINFEELLCPSLGKLTNTLQINYVVDTDWLMDQLKGKNLEKIPLTIICGHPDEKSDQQKKELPETVEYLEMKHDDVGYRAKLGIYLYQDKSLRVVVSSANLTEKSWADYNHIMWISPPCPKLAGKNPQTRGESPTLFKSSLLTFLQFYNRRLIEPWLKHVENADFSDVKVFLVTSVNGVHNTQQPLSHLQIVGDLLKRHCNLPKNAISWEILAQASCLGNYGNSPDNWLAGRNGVILKALEGHKDHETNSRYKPGLSVVYPTEKNVEDGIFGPGYATPMAPRHDTTEIYPWLRSYLRQWKADDLERTAAMPHQKIYCRYSPCLNKLAWFLLTSANLTKSGWGSGYRYNGNVFVRNFEVGVLFFPKFFNEDYFEIKKLEKNKKLFPFMCDLPLVKYGENDEPWSRET